MTLRSSFPRKNCVLSHFEAARWRIWMDNSISVGKVDFHKTLPCPASPCLLQFMEWNHKAAGFKQKKWKCFLPTLVELSWGRVCPGVRRPKSCEEPKPTSALSDDPCLRRFFPPDGYKSNVSLPWFPQDPTAAEKTWILWIKDLPIFSLLDWFHTSVFSFPFMQESEQELKATGRDNTAQTSCHQWQRKSWHCPVKLCSADP